MLLADSPRDGGAEALLRDMARAGLQDGHDVVLMGRPRPLLERIAQDVPGLRLRVIDAPDFRETTVPRQRHRRLLVQAGALALAIRAERPDILQVSNGGYPGSALCLLALPLAAALRVPRRLLAVHAVPRDRPGGGDRAHALLDTVVWRSTHAVWGGTDVVGHALARTRGMPAGHYVRIPYGVPAPARGPDADVLRERWRDGSDDLLVGMVSGTSDAQKGHRVLVEALGNVPEGVRGVVVGADPPPEAAGRARELALGDRLIVAGRVPDVDAAYHAFDALCVPSVADESLPLVVLEAFGAGVPVIASRLSGLPEAVRDEENGRLFTPGDAAALTAIIARAAADRSTLARWGEVARADWRALYSPEAMRTRILALWAGDQGLSSAA